MLIQSQMNPVHSLQIPFIYFNIIAQLSLCLPNAILPSRFPSKTLYEFLSSTERAAHTANLIPAQPQNKKWHSSDHMFTSLQTI
jgi:hypothetical protein